MLHLICNIIKNFNSYRRETLWQVSSYRRRTLYLWFYNCKPHLINLVHKNNALLNLLVKINHFGHRELLASKVLLNLCLNLLCLFCFVKLMPISIKWQQLFFGWLYIPGIQFFWTSLTHVEHCSIIPLIFILLHLILVTAPKCGYSSSVGM